MERAPEPSRGPAREAGAAPRPPVVLAISDLILGSRARDVLKSLDLDVIAASSAQDLLARLDGRPSLCILDLGEPQWMALDAIRRAKTHGVSVLAFGRHTDAATLDAASEAGANRVVARSVFAASLADLVRELVPQEAGAGERLPSDGTGSLGDGGPRRQP